MKTLLIATDSRTRQLLGDALRRRKHKVTLAEDGEAACELLRSGEHALVILDADGPGEESVRLCRRLKAAVPGGSTVILAANGHHQPDHLSDLLSAGVDDFLPELEDTERLDLRLTVAEHRAANGSSPGPLPNLPINQVPLLSKAPYGVFRSSLGGKFLEVNQALVTMLGYDSEEELLQVELARDLYRDPAIRTQLIADPVDHRRGAEIDWKRKDGTSITVRMSGRAVRDESGARVLLEGIVEDVTGRKEAERGVRESEAKFRSLFENLPDYVLMLDCQATIQYVNHPAPNTTIEDLVGSTGFDFIAPEHQGPCREALGRAPATRQPQTVETLDIFGCWWACRLVPLVERSEVRNVMVICTEVSEQKMHKEELLSEQRLLRQLLDLHERDRQLIAYEIHDGFAQQLIGAQFNLEAFKQLPDHGSDSARRLFDAGLRLLGESIEETRRLISGLRPPILDEFGIVAAIDYLVCESQERRGIQIEFYHDVKFDRLAAPLESTVFRIIQESLTNAFDHSQSEKVRVELVQRTSSAGRERIRVEVIDWGIGFDPDTIAANRFGLRGIRERTRLFGGEVVVDATPGKGTRIAVELPLIEAAEEQSGP